MTQDDEETRNLVPQTPKAKKTSSPDDSERLPAPDHFDHRLSTDSNVSAPASEPHSNPTSSKGGLDNGQYLDPDALRQVSANTLNYVRSASPGFPRVTSRSGAGRRPWQPDGGSWSSKIVEGLERTWVRNKGVILVAVSQLFGALMNLSARLLELEGDGMNPFQVLFARQSLTMIFSVVYMWVRKTPDFPLGAPGVRLLLLVRGFCGFFGIWGMWQSMLYLGLAEATVITFLAPSVAGFACYVAFREPFTRVEMIGSFAAFAGVILMAHPTAWFSTDEPTSGAPPDGAPNINGTTGSVSDEPASGNPGLDHDVTPSERLWAIGVGLIGVLGAAGAYTTIRWIGKRTHALISVNYFAAWCTLVSGLMLLLGPVLDIGQPGLQFALPAGARQWFLLIFLGIMGFVMQFILTMGLAADRSNRANAMVFTHMLFAAAFDKFIFGQSMGMMSLAGCWLIIGGALYMVLWKDSGAGPVKLESDVEADAGQGSAAGPRDVGVGGVSGTETETVPMLLDVDHDEEERREAREGTRG